MKKIVNPWIGMDGYSCFGCAPHNEAGVKMEFYEDGDDVVSVWHPEPKYQGWTHTLHGGIQATLLDEISAWTIARKLQTTGVTSKMELRYLKPVHTTDEYLVIRGTIAERKRNIVTVDACIYDQAGEPCTKASCTYFTFSKEKALNELHFSGCEVEKEDVNPLEGNPKGYNVH